MNQLYELLTEYGPIHEVWFDGAHPKRKGGQKYIRDEWFAMIRKLAPDAVIFGGPDVRWCGNEKGDTRETEWNVLTVESLKVSGFDRPRDELATDRMITAKGYDVYREKFKSNYLYYLIPEVDTSIRDGWFWRNDTEQYVKSADEIFDIYERAVGGNSVFLLNIPPNRYGKFSQRDEKCLIEVGKRIRKTYNTDLSKGASANVGKLFDNNIETYWQADKKNTSFTVTLPNKQKINRVILQEAISKVGQRVKEHQLDAWVDGKYKQVAKGTTIGYKKILRFKTVVTDRLRVRIFDARKEPAIASFSAHYYQKPVW
jgi:alpha-L-fucosidase